MMFIIQWTAVGVEYLDSNSLSEGWRCRVFDSEHRLAWWLMPHNIYALDHGIYVCHDGDALMLGEVQEVLRVCDIDGFRQRGG